jgi:IclR family acetate operon transcriptional repressor
MPIVRSVERASRIMESLFLAPEGRHLTDISRQLGLHKTTVLRLLRTLMAVHLVEKDEASERYRWEPHLWFGLASRVRQLWARVDLAQDLLQRLAAATGESTALMVPDFQRRQMVLVASALSDKALLVDPAVGGRALPMNATAAGKSYLAGLPEAELEQWLQGELPRRTEHTITSPDRLREDLKAVRQRGYAIAREEWLPGACGLAAAVVDGRGRTVGSLGVVVPLARMTEANVARWLPLLRQTASRVSALVGPGDPSFLRRLGAAQRLAEGEGRPAETPGGVRPRRVYGVV